jgi:hypothetical protein
VPGLVDDWRPWVAAAISFGLVMLAVVLVDRVLDTWTLVAPSCAAAAASTLALSVVLHRVVERHRSLQRALLLAHHPARKLVELLGACAKQ